MFGNSPRLRRSFVGYSKKDVLQTLDEQETMVRQAQQSAEAAKAAAARLEDEIGQLREDAEARGQQAQALQAQFQQAAAEVQEHRQLAERYRAEATQYRAEADRLRAEAERERAEAERERAEAERARQEADAAQAPDRLAELLNEELAQVLAAAKESAQRIIDRAEESGRGREARAEEVWEDVQAELDRFTTWWERVEPVIREVQKRIEEARHRADEVADRIRQALGPTLQAMIDVDTDLGRLQDSAMPPQIKPRSGAQDDEDDAPPYDASVNGEDQSENGEDPSAVVQVEEPASSDRRSDGHYDPDYWG
jgi:chromosome segregation ATPase